MDGAKETSKWADLRRRAESVLGSEIGASEIFGREEMLHLIHELEVHQVELEIQGEELRQKNVDLQELMHKYIELYQQAPVGFVTLDTRGIVVEVNRRAAEMLGSPPRRLRRSGFSRFVHTEDHAKYFNILADLSRTPWAKAQGEIRLTGKNGDPFYAGIDIVQLRNNRHEVQGWLIALVDISGRKSAEEKLHAANGQLEESRKQLKALSARLLSAHEEERKRIAAELHDSFGQTLAAMKFCIENALGKSARQKSEEAVSVLEHLVPTLQGAIEEVRTIYTGLRPTILDDFGIIAAIRWFCKQVRAAFPQIHIEVAVEIEEEDVPERLKIVIFRIIQEALNNVTKHSGAEWADLSLVRKGGEIELCIQDDGVGFLMENGGWSKSPQGIGLGSMRERAEFSGGVLSVESSVGEGTTVRARWNVEEQEGDSTPWQPPRAQDG